jgi:HAD superfamily hydrolase (TIGR01450 family)
VKVSAFLIDRDGVLRFAKGGELIPGAREWMQRLSESGIPYLIATNHTTSSPETGARELEHLGFPVQTGHMHTPLTILEEVFSRHPPGKIFIRSAPDLMIYLESLGLDLTAGHDADTVLLGFDQKMDYRALSVAISAILNHGAQFIALHENRIYRNATGDVEPGLGAWVRAVEYATGVPARIIGKPNPYYYQAALRRLGSGASETLMISDDPLGDLAGAKQCGIQTVFVTSGKYQDCSVLDSLDRSLHPDLIIPTISDYPL